MMTLHKLSVSDGYSYLSREVASSDTVRTRGQSLSDYYLETGDAPGRWLGGGAAELAVTGTVTEGQMKALFKYGAYPDREQIVAEHVSAGRTVASGEAAAQLGRRFPTFSSEGRSAVAGYDLVFGPVKSVSVLWALGGEQIRREVEAAHREALLDVLSWLESNAVFTRTGPPLRDRLRTRGLICAAFDHRDSRAGDPDLHTHVAVSNKVRAVDDHPGGRPRYMSLDGSVLFAAGRAASERYLSRAEDRLAARLGLQFAPRADTTGAGQRTVREVVGVPDELIRHFSSRRVEITKMHAEMVLSYRVRYGRRPSAATAAKLAQMATLATRPDKAAPRSLESATQDWTRQAAAVVGEHRVHAIREAVGRAPGAPSCSSPTPDALARTTVATLELTRTTWTRWDVLAEVERQTRSLRPASADARDALVTDVVEHVVSPVRAMRLGSGVRHQPLVGPWAPTRSAPVDTARYTTTRILEAEADLVAAAREVAPRAARPEWASQAVEAYQRGVGRPLGADEVDLVIAFTSLDARVVAGIASSGADKTAAVRAACHVWDTAGATVVPVATSTASADVLSKELGRPAENLQSLLDDLGYSKGDPRLRTLGRGDVVLVDEAGMAGTLRLARLLDHARAANASVRLVGDPTQLAARESGAVLRLITSEVGALPLRALHQLTDPQYAKAASQLQTGDPACLDYYADDHRLRSGTRQEMLAAAWSGWEQDVRAGLSSLMVCPSDDEAAALARRARTCRAEAGDVAGHGVGLADGNRASAGDWVVTDVGVRTLTTRGGRDFVKTGDAWTVVGRHPDDSLTVRNQRHQGQLTLPGDYVREHVRLAYALTPERCRSVSVDTAHPVVGPWSTRESLYVAATRGRQATTVYVGLSARPDQPADHTESSSEARRVLASVLTRRTRVIDDDRAPRPLGDHLRQHLGHVRRLPAPGMRPPAMR